MSRSILMSLSLIALGSFAVYQLSHSGAVGVEIKSPAPRLSLSSATTKTSVSASQDSDTDSSPLAPSDSHTSSHTGPDTDSHADSDTDRVNASTLASTAAAENRPPQESDLFYEIKDPVSERQIEERAQLPMRRAREARFDLRALQNGSTSEQTLRLNLFPDVNLVASVQLNEEDDTVLISGQIKGDLTSNVHLTRIGDVLVGTINHDGRAYMIQDSGHGTQYIVEIDPEQTPNDENCVVPMTESDENEELATLEDDLDTATERAAFNLAPSYVRLSVLYTTDAKIAAGGRTPILAEIRNEVNKINAAFTQSKVNARIQLAGIREIRYNQGTISIRDLLKRLKDPSDKHMDSAHAIRKTLQSDLMLLYVPKSIGNCGVAYFGMTNTAAMAQLGFSVAARSCNFKFSVTHEIGHNFGADHDKSNATTQSVSYARGSFNFSNKFRTVMAYPCANERDCPRINQFSNPRATFNGASTGTAYVRDNVRRMNQLTPYISKIRSHLQ